MQYKTNLSYKLRQARNSIYRFRKNSGFDKYRADVIVTGNQKSGTSAIASLLALSVGKEVTIDIFSKMGLYEYRLLQGRDSFEGFLAKSRCYWARPIVKEPELIFFIDRLVEFFPSSRFVFILRSPFENIRSILNRLGLSSGEAESITIYDKLFDPGAPLWNLLESSDYLPFEGNNLFESLVARWNYAASVAIQHSESFILVRYEDFVRDKEKFITSLAAELGYEVVQDIRPSLDVQFQPKGSGVSVRDFFTESQIEYIHMICGEAMGKHGY